MMLTARKKRIMFQNLDAFSIQSSLPDMYVGGVASDDVSVPTVEEFSLADTNVSTSEKDFISSHSIHLPNIIEDDDDLSESSINTRALNQISELKSRLKVQENTKLELLNQCLELESQLEKYESTVARTNQYKADNHKLRETNTKMEHDFMNAMNEVVVKMANMEAEYHEKLQWREEKIKVLEEDLALLRASKNIDPASTIETFSLKLSKSYDSLNDFEDGYSLLHEEQRDDDRQIMSRQEKLIIQIPSEVIIRKCKKKTEKSW